MGVKLGVASTLAPTFGAWRVVQKIGEGASGSVFEVEQNDVRGAMKVLRTGFDFGEASILARVSRTWGPALLDVGRVEGSVAIVTSFVEGESVDAARGDETRVWSIVHAVARGLEELHEANVRHGDVKPENVLFHPTNGKRDVASERSATLIDLGLASEFGETAKGGTARYAAPELRGGGDVGPRADVFALGVMTLELLGEALAKSELAEIARAMCAASAGARPSAGWVAERAARALGLAESEEARANARVAQVKRVYVAARAREIAVASGVADSLTGKPRAWLEEAVGIARKISGAAEGEIGASSAIARARWIVGLVGTSAASWSIEADDATLAEKMCVLAEARPFGAWTANDLMADSASDDVEIEAGDAGAAIALMRAFPPAAVIAQVEARGAAAPWALREALALALMRKGEAARAMLALRGDDGLSAVVRRAEVARRLGDRASAEALACAALEAPATSSTRALRARAAAVVARIAWDAGDDARASRELESHAGPGVAEVEALVAWRRGDFDRGARVVDAALADCQDAIARARLHATRGFLSHAAGRAKLALDDYARAVDLAERAGAVADEATYLVGQSASATDAGDIGCALAASTRAALLLERLSRMREASNAWLVRAAALATVGDAHGADEAASEVLAREATDDRTRAYARWARVETRAPGDARASEDARAALATFAVDPSSDDAVRAAARVLVWAPDALDDARVDALDRIATTATPAAAWDWLGARARVCVENARHAARATDVLRRILAVAQIPAPHAARGPALAFGRDLAMKLGEGEAARRLETLRRATAATLRATTPDALKDSLANVAWMRDEGAIDDEPFAPAQLAQLETIIRSLSSRDRLRPLLLQVLDAMILWVGVERGLLLLRAPNGKLVPRAARNLAREDLHGEQLTLSMTLARRAIDSGEAVVATDAFATMGDVHASVHALKLRSVLAVPLATRGEPLGVVYLDDRGRRGAFGPRELAWVRLLATQAALAIADARDQVLLRRAARRAERAKSRIESLLAEREAELAVTQQELSQARGDETRFKYDAIAGRSESMQKLLHVVDRVTTSDVPVLVVGESGTGKELIARAMHENGPRARRPFVSENCAAVPESLLESTLFGHVRGAFTGASQTRAGLFEIADGGTHFLDEIGEMPLAMQAKLLRVLQDGEVRAVGSERTRKVNVRLIAATHRDLETMVEKRTFREDLYYRLNVVTVRMPPLRERRGDIPLIIAHLLKKHAAGKKIRVTKLAMDRLVQFAWPGNVRQLENEIRRALVLCDANASEPTIDAHDLSPDLLRGDAPRDVGFDLRARVDALEADLLREALDKTHGNQTKAAELLGLSRFGLQKMMRRLKVAPKAEKPS